MKDSNFTRINLEELSKEPEEEGDYYLYRDRYWAIDKNGMGLIYGPVSYQCNKNRDIVELLIKGIKYPGRAIKFMSKVWIRR